VGSRQILRVKEKTRLVVADLRGTRRTAPRRDGPPLPELRELLASRGIGRGDCLMVHSSWDALSGGISSPTELISCLRELVGSQGTLCMPAYHRFRPGQEPVFDLKRTPSAAGLVTEVVRRLPGARRSAQQRSVAAHGPAAEELVREHHLSPYPSGPVSPHAKLAELRGKVLCLGVGPEFNTMFHCGEDILGPQFPVSVYEEGESELRVRTEAGEELAVRNLVRSDRWTQVGDAVRLLPYLDRAVQSRTLAALEVHLTQAAPFLEQLLALARQGIHMYGFRFPSPRS
jgi:aminoglycoside 3-N-acetyltransferase